MYMIVTNELKKLSDEMVKTIEREDKEYAFKKNKGYVERNISASKFKRSILGLDSSDFNKIVSNR